LFWSKQNTEHVAVVQCKLQFAVTAAIIVYPNYTEYLQLYTWNRVCRVHSVAATL